MVFVHGKTSDHYGLSGLFNLDHAPRPLFCWSFCRNPNCRSSGLLLLGKCVLRPASLQMGYLKKSGDGSLLYSVVNTAEPDADGGWSSQGCFLLRAFMLF